MFEVIAKFSKDKLVVDNSIIKVLDDNVVKVEDSLNEEENYFIKFNKIYNNQSNTYIFRDLFPKLENGVSIVFYGPDIKLIFSEDTVIYNKHLQTEFIFYFVYYLNYDCEITADLFENNTAFNLIENRKRNDNINLELETISRTWELINSRQDFSMFYINLYSLIKKRNLNNSKLLISMKSKYLRNNINILYLDQNCKNNQFIKNIALGNKNNYFKKLFCDSERKILLIDDKNKNIMDNLNLVRKIIPLKKENIKKELLKNVDKLISEYRNKIKSPLYSLKLEEDKPIYKSNLNEFKQNFTKLATINRFIYEIVIKNQVLIEKNYNNYVDNEIIIYLKSMLSENLKFILNEIDKIN